MYKKLFVTCITTEIENIHTIRYDFGLTVFGTQLAAFGGQPTINSEQIEVYNRDSQTWELTGKNILLHERHYFACLSIPSALFPNVTLLKWQDTVATSTFADDKYQ